MIHSTDIEVVPAIRAQMVLDAREAVRLGVYDAPGIFDAALDNLIDRAESEERIREGFEAARDEEFRRQVESDQ